eukprot:CAMPEP_0117000298 /NCGR_PEP_ID=MMETSP0472-20121206/2690_1 /TAXON_ID=693140 ORGANISM="Tiarina fusus, Strain LIS" /NCGR_SAMPLE_ID=MMETSP0472 /ASSEMBLY_ACC=CAM_ASM_000603 /LENGTH=1327 /DNA_ID=CAMNT_0004699951 /DNA_START=722 /DNA_END=4702 /DNA_ORIENTATION=+
MTKANEFKRRKVVILGGEGTGKTSIVKCLTGGKVDINKRIKDENVSIRDCTMAKMEITLWNLGGPVVTSPTHNFFMDTDCIYILTFNFSNLILSEMEYWLKLIKSTLNVNHGTALVVAVGTHSEKVTDEEVANTIEIIQAKFPKRVFPFLQDVVPLSCKTTNGLTSLKKKLKECAKNPCFPVEVSPPWIQLSMKIKSVRATGREYVTYDEYSKWAEGVGIFEADELERATSFLSSIGCLISFKKRFDVNILFLDPNCLVTLMENIADVGPELDLPGFIPKHNLKTVCKNFPESMLNEIFSLLSHLRIFIYLPNQPAGLFVTTTLPKLAPRSAISKIFPVKLEDNQACFGRVFKFQQLPLGLIDRILASTLNIPGVKQEVIWRCGLMVRQENSTLASVEYFPESYKLSVELRFDKTDKTAERIALAFWRQLLENFRTQMEGFCAAVSWQEFVPCIHCIRRGVFRDRVYLFDYQQVIDAMETPVMYCNNIESPSRCIARMEVAPDISLRDLPQVSQRRLTIGEQIGEGGFGVVYKGSLEKNVVAVKELTCAGTLDGDLFREFQVEAFIQGLLDHPNCVKLFGLTANPPRMILEFVSGGDLCHLIHPKKTPKPTLQTLPWTRRYAIAFDIIKGLYHMQTRNPPIIHRDIRSPNIFMTKEGKALIGDFGLARQVNPDVGGMLGTWQWLAPECIDSVELNSYDTRTDIYSFGMVLWELATCDVPFEEFMDDPRYAANGKLKLQDLKRAIIDEHLRPSLPDDAPPTVKDIIQRCWNVDVNQRPTCVEILQLLGTACGKTAEANAELNHKNQVSMDSRLSSHLVSFSAPTIHPEVPLGALKVSKEDGKPRTLVGVGGDTVWAGSTRGYIHILSRGANNKINLVRKWQAHAGRVAMLVCDNARVWSCSDDEGNVRIWNIQERSIEHSFTPFTTGGKAVRGCGPSNILIVHQTVWICSTQNGQINIYNSSTFEQINTIQTQDLIGMSGMALHKDHVWIGNGGKIFMYDATSYECIGSFQAHNSGRMQMYIESVGDTVWSASSADMRIWDAPSLELMSLAKEVSISDSKYLCLRYSPDTGRVFTGSFNGELVMWNTRGGDAMQEMVPSALSIADITAQGEYVWCVTSFCEIFIFSANLLHPKPKLMKMDIKTIRNKPASPLLPSERNRMRTGSISSKPGRKKQKGVTLRKSVDEGGLSEEEVAKKLANPMLTLRRMGTASAPTSDPPIPIRVLASNGQVLPCNITADKTTKVATLLQKLIPLALKQMNIYQPGFPFEIMWCNGNTPTRFTTGQLPLALAQFGVNFILNRIPIENMTEILALHKIGVYCVLNDTPEPS